MVNLWLRQLWNQIDSFWRRRRGPDDAAFVSALYDDILGRPADAEAQSNALQGLQQGALSRGQLRRLLIEAPEARAYGLLRQLYGKLLDREPTVEERWQGVRLLQESDLDPTPLRHALTDTLEHLFRTTAPPPEAEPYMAAALPREVWLELTTRCNMRPYCIMCGKSAEPAGTRGHDMDPQIWQHLLPMMQQAQTVGLHGGGEPLLYPQIFALLDELDGAKTNIGFNTNGHLLTEENCRRLIEQQVAWVSISMDAASPEMYLRLRRSERHGQLLDKIRRFGELKDQLGSTKPRIDVNMTVMCTNLPEVVPFVEMAAGLGLSRVTLQQIIPGGDWTLDAPDGYCFDYAQEELRHCLPQHAEVMVQAWQRGQELGVALDYEIAYADTRPDWPEPSTTTVPPQEESLQVTPPEHPPLPPAFCQDPWTTFMVYADGSVTFCCYHYPDAILGNLTGQSLEAVWNGPRARTIRRWVLEQEQPRCCQGCFKVC